MNQLKHALLLLCLVTLGAIGLSSCTEPEKPTTKTTIALDQTDQELKVGDTFTLKAKLTPSNAKEQITWSSSKSDVATVDNGGKVTAKAAGEAIITATLANGNKATCNVKVTKKEEPQKPDTPKEKTAITLDKSKHELKVGETFTLKATLAPENAKDKISWSSSKVEVATVNDKGEVTAKGEGEATITAALENGNKATCTLTVKKKDAPAPKGKLATLKFKKDKYHVAIGKTLELKGEVEVTKGDNPKEDLTIIWMGSSDESIAELDDETGAVTGIAAGEVTITADLDNGNSATCTVVVDNKGGDDEEETPGDDPEKPEVKEVTINPWRIKLIEGSTQKLEINYNGVKKEMVTLLSQDPKIATVTNDGLVKAVKQGSTRIIVEVNGRQQSSSTLVIVNEKKDPSKFTYEIHFMKKKGVDFSHTGENIIKDEVLSGDKGKKVARDDYKSWESSTGNTCYFYLNVTNTETKEVRKQLTDNWEVTPTEGNKINVRAAGFTGAIEYYYIGTDKITEPEKSKIRIKNDEYGIDETITLILTPIIKENTDKDLPDDDDDGGSDD